MRGRLARARRSGPRVDGAPPRRLCGARRSPRRGMSHVTDWLRYLIGVRPIEEVIDARATIAAARAGHVTIRGRIEAGPMLHGEFVPDDSVFARVVVTHLVP